MPHSRKDFALRMSVLLAGATGALSAQTLAPAGGLTRLTVRASVATGGGQGNGMSETAALSSNGRVVAFHSAANNLVPGDTNGAADVFVRNLVTARTERVSVNSVGVQGNSTSLDPALSANGRFVTFYSYASNLAPGDTNGFADVFVHDRWNGTTTRVSVDSNGAQANHESRYGSISGDGRKVVFESSASNLVQDDTNDRNDTFLRDLWSGTTVRVSVTTSGVQGNGYSDALGSISAGGGFVVFQSTASNFAPGDTNSTYDVFVRDLAAGTTECVSVTPAGSPGNGRSFGAGISGDGRWVVFESLSSNLVAGDTNGTNDIFLRDRTAGSTVRISVGPGGVQANGQSDWPTMSDDGTVVAFESGASNLVPGDSNFVRDVFVRDLLSGTNEFASVRSNGAQGHAMSQWAALSADGRTVAFHSLAALVPGDTNARHDVLVRTSLVTR